MSEFKRLKRSMSFSSYEDLSRYHVVQQSHSVLKEIYKRPESSLLQSISKSHIIRKEDSEFDSPCEHTILDVLGMVNTSREKRKKE